MRYVWIVLALVACSGNVEHKVSGDTTSTVDVTQSICTLDNGFTTPADRKECILCMRDVTLCPHPCAKPTAAE